MWQTRERKKIQIHMIELLNPVTPEHDATSGLSEYISM